MKLDFYYWGSICPLSVEIIRLLKKYEKYLSIEYYDITDDFELAKKQNIYFPFLTVIDECYRYYSPLSESFMEQLKCGSLPVEKPYRINQGEIEVEGYLLPITNHNYILAAQCTGRNDCMGCIDKCHMYPLNDIFGYMNVKHEALLGGAEFYPSLKVPYNIPKDKDTAFITCVYSSDEKYDFKSKPLQALEKYLASSYSKLIVISDEEGTFPNGNLAFFKKNGYIDERVVYEDDYCKLHLLSKELNKDEKLK